MMLVHLIGLAPLDKITKDKHGWGTVSGRYSMTKGYHRLYANYNVPGNPGIWNYLWNCGTVPKIEMFTWSLMHGRVVTCENLEKMGIVGPFHYPLYAQASETISHLFLKCPYAISI